MVSSLSSKSQHHWLIQQILTEKFDVYLTNEIVLEYEEILINKYSVPVANNFLTALKELPNVYFIQLYYNRHLLSDEDDNKFVDCVIAANANYLVSNDKDFNILKQITFPKINVVLLEEFKDIVE